jgi:hypothetical protein
MHIKSSLYTNRLVRAASARRTGLGVALIMIGLMGTADQLPVPVLAPVALPLLTILFVVVATALIPATLHLLVRGRTSNHRARPAAGTARLTHWTHR